jgi:predicted metal-binding membrane protein
LRVLELIQFGWLKVAAIPMLMTRENYCNMEKFLKRDRKVVLTGLALISVLSWAYMFYLAGKMHTGLQTSKGVQTALQGASMPKIAAWTSTDLFFVFLMWVVMMIAMMIPSAAPFILTFSKVMRKRHTQEDPYKTTGFFVLGYLTVWAGFSLLATFVQWGLFSATLLTASIGRIVPTLGGAILLAAGIFQWTPLKQACLSHCRTPIGFLLEDWREGNRGAFVMGLQHGGFCTACCWALMALMFVAGVMNVLWMALIAILILIEKVAPAGDWFGRAAGIGLAAWGGWLILSVL